MQTSLPFVLFVDSPNTGEDYNTYKPMYNAYKLSSPILSPCLRGTKIAIKWSIVKLNLNYAEQKQFGRSQPKAEVVKYHEIKNKFLKTK